MKRPSGQDTDIRPPGRDLFEFIELSWTRRQPNLTTGSLRDTSRQNQVSERGISVGIWRLLDGWQRLDD